MNWTLIVFLMTWQPAQHGSGWSESGSYVETVSFTVPGFSSKEKCERAFNNMNLGDTDDAKHHCVHVN